MGYDNEGAGKVVFDIETAPLTEAGEYLEPAEAPANYKDPEKIAAFIASKNAENLDRCGLDVDLCRVVAVAWQREGREPMSMLDDEATMLRYVWDTLGHSHLIGFNCLAFDLPVLLRRSQYLGIPTPAIQMDKYRHPTVTDLAMVLSFNGLVRMRGLSFYAKRFGIDVPDPMVGADIAQAVKDGDWDGIEHHVKADVQKTAAIAEKLGLFHQHPALVA